MTVVSSQTLLIAAAVVVALILVGALVWGLVRHRRGRISLSAPQRESLDRSGGYTASSGITFSRTDTAQPHDPAPVIGDDATVPRDAPRRTITDIELPEAPPEVPSEPQAAPAPETVEPDIEPVEGRMERLRGRLAKSQNALGRGMLGLLGGGDLDDDSWQDVEDTLLVADLGPVVTESVVNQLRGRLAGGQVRTEAEARAVLRDVLIGELQPGLERSIRALPHDDHPSVLLVVGVNGTGKTTTVGKLARVLVADGRRVVLGAADTFRAAAADQLQTWAARVGAEVVRGAEGADPASVAFDAVDKGVADGVDVVVIDTAGRLHTKTGLMDELGKVKRVVERRAAVDEVLLVLDATIGQNGLAQARVFADVVDITGVVLTKLDGTAKGGIVFRVQQELGVPVKLVGLGEGPDDLAPFEPGAFVDALLG
ncbi:signal recognition particle-docking protein FtsY [Mycolicibacter virginiensis]|uniref:Signal recognition particle receptor FtsY n=1 Tax=Mycolicibacter virginiensis TaxID=1795032 RepID=A0A9X7NWD7_9MYCO|nr:signal recognition particle-docking protein FtsY [Mycolicibacter virginiensis]